MLVDEEVPTSYEEPRNPSYVRNWPHWTKAPSPLPGDRRIIIISNSQGFLREREEGEMTYAGVLERELNLNGKLKWKVLNWSIPGGQTPEMIVLGARTAVHKPEHVLVITFPGNFRSDLLSHPLSYAISDVPLLTASKQVTRHLSSLFIERFRAGGLPRFIQLNTGFGALRWRTFIENQEETWHWKVREPSVDLKSLNLGTSEWNDGSNWLARELVQTIRRAAPEAEISLIVMPLAQAAWSKEAWQSILHMEGRLKEAVGGIPHVNVLSAADLVPSHLFYTHNHMKPEGHVLFARWLADTVIRPSPISQKKTDAF